MIVSRLTHPLVGTVCVITAAAIIYWLWYAIMMFAGTWAWFHLPYGYHLIVQHLAGCIFLLCVSIVYHKRIAPLGLGCVRQRSSVLPAIAVLAVYTIEFAYGRLTGQQPEQWVVEQLHQPLWQLISFFITILVLAPIGEEILFRGVLLNVFRTTHSWTLWAGVVIIALVFASIHKQYENLSTMAELLLLAVIFAWARLRSGGLLLPILLHSFAAILGSSANLL